MNSFWTELLRAEIHRLVKKKARVSGHTQRDDDSLWVEDQATEKLRDMIDFKRDKLNRPSTYLTPQQWLDWYSQLLSATIAIATLGAGFTFTLIFSALDRPRSTETQADDIVYVRTCIAASWMLFVLSLGWSSFVALIVSVNRTAALRELGTDKRWYQHSMLALMNFGTFIAQLLPCGAILASAEGVRQYQSKIGIVTLTLVSLTAFVAILAWLGQHR